MLRSFILPPPRAFSFTVWFTQYKARQGPLEVDDYIKG